MTLGPDATVYLVLRHEIDSTPGWVAKAGPLEDETP